MALRSNSEEKVEAIKRAPRPKTLTQLRAFLGIINYHGKLIRNLSSILQPLIQLLQSNKEFKWYPLCKEAFKKAKDSLSPPNVLVRYDPSLPVILESDFRKAFDTLGGQLHTLRTYIFYLCFKVIP